MKNDWQKKFINGETVIDLIIGPRSLSPKFSYDIYIQDYQARMIEALSKNFEGTWLILGDEIFLKLAKEYIMRYPSRHFSLNTYGSHFPEFLEENNEKDASQMAAYELSFWSLFHSKRKMPIELDLNNFEDIEFDLNDVHLFSSEVNLSFVFKNREKGIDEKDLEEVYKKSNIVLYKSNNLVENAVVNDQVFFFLVEMKEKKRMNLVTVIDLLECDWHVIFEILRFTNQNVTMY